MKQAQRFSPHREWGPALTARTAGPVASDRGPDVRVSFNFFGPGSPYLGHPLLTSERTAAEVDEICGQFSMGSLHGLDVLDIGCGFGRHAIEFARRGASVIAVDPSSTMIEAAKTAGAEFAIDWRVAAGEALTDRAIADLTICLFTTFGQLQAESPNPDASVHALLESLVGATRPGGQIVIEVPERDRAVDMLVESESLGAPENQTAVSRRFDATTSVLHERFETSAGDTFDLAYQLFTKAELVDICEQAGLVDIVTVDRALVPPPPTFVTLYASCPNG